MISDENKNQIVIFQMETGLSIVLGEYDFYKDLASSMIDLFDKYAPNYNHELILVTFEEAALIKENEDVYIYGANKDKEIIRLIDLLDGSLSEDTLDSIIESEKRPLTYVFIDRPEFTEEGLSNLKYVVEQIGTGYMDGFYSFYDYMQPYPEDMTGLEGIMSRANNTKKIWDDKYVKLNGNSHVVNLIMKDCSLSLENNNIYLPAVVYLQEQMVAVEHNRKVREFMEQFKNESSIDRKIRILKEQFNIEKRTNNKED